MLSLALAIGGYSNSDYARTRSLINLGETYLNDLNYEEAIATFKEALTISPNNTKIKDLLTETYISYANELVQTENYDKALEILSEGYEVTGEEGVLFLKEEVEAKVNEMEEAERLAKEEEEKKAQEEAEQQAKVES